jgi:hypothetical protein
VPLNEFGTSEYGYPTFARPRGTAGRSPAVWNTDLRVTWAAPIRGARGRPQLLLDVFNLGNQRRPEILIQSHYVSADNAVNPNHGRVRQYQAPLAARAGVMVGF